MFWNLANDSWQENENMNQWIEGKFYFGWSGNSEDFRTLLNWLFKGSLQEHSSLLQQLFDFFYENSRKNKNEKKI